jgi:transmembrane sensor
MSQPKDAATEEITRRAAEWFERQREGGLSAVERQAFAQWLSESPVHIREYLAVTETWGAMRAGSPWPEESAEQLIAAARASNTVTQLPPQRRPVEKRSRSVSRRSRWGAVAAIGLVCVLAWSFAGWAGLPWAKERFSTDRGEQRSIALEDGSVIQLNTLTRVRVRYEKDRRVIELPEGEAFFRVAADVHRPFDVVTPLGTVRAVGTEFNVYNRAGDMRVVVVEGKVQVAYENPHAPPAAIKSVVPLKARQSLEVNASGGLTPDDGKRSVETATAWMQRRLAFENERLDVIVTEFNRYNRQQMRIDDDELLQLRINGIFNADDPGALAKYLQRVLDVEIEVASGNTLVLRRRNKSVSVY